MGSGTTTTTGCDYCSTAPWTGRLIPRHGSAGAVHAWWRRASNRSLSRCSYDLPSSASAPVVLGPTTTTSAPAGRLLRLHHYGSVYRALWDGFRVNPSPTPWTLPPCQPCWLRYPGNSIVYHL